MTGIGIITVITAIFTFLLTATASWAFGGVTMNLLMPGPPTNVIATAGNGEATVSFKPPKSGGAKPITNYTVMSHPGHLKAYGKESPITVKGLNNGRTYTFTVTATSSIGTGIDSAPSNDVTPRAQ